MSPTRAFVLLLTTSLASLVAAQGQGVLVNGNSNLPACAQTCQALNQAAQACSGTTSATDQTWICFCQSAYLTSLKTPGSNLCSASCSSTADNNQISTWYTTNCGSDNGASEHAGDSSAATTTSAADAATRTSAATAATGTSGSSSGSSSNSNSNSGFNAGANQTGQDWWSSHYQYIIMLIILVIALPLLAWLAIWLKRRHDRKMDQMSEGFNAGITERAAPAPMSNPDANLSAGAGSFVDGSGRNSPARTREAIMPFGYGYTRSESRLGSRQAVNDDRRSPLARGEVDPEKEAGADKRTRRVLVRERSTEDDIQREKR